MLGSIYSISIFDSLMILRSNGTNNESKFPISIPFLSCQTVVPPRSSDTGCGCCCCCDVVGVLPKLRQKSNVWIGTRLFADSVSSSSLSYTLYLLCRFSAAAATIACFSCSCVVVDDDEFGIETLSGMLLSLLLLDVTLEATTAAAPAEVPTILFRIPEFRNLRRLLLLRLFLLVLLLDRPPRLRLLLLLLLLLVVVDFLSFSPPVKAPS